MTARAALPLIVFKWRNRDQIRATRDDFYSNFLTLSGFSLLPVSGNAAES